MTRTQREENESLWGYGQNRTWGKKKRRKKHENRKT